MKKYLILILLSTNFLMLIAQEKPDKQLLLIQASEAGNTSQVIKLLNKNTDPNIETMDGMSPLHYAVQNGHLTTVKALVLNGARINQRDNENRTPLLLAVHFNHLDIAEYLVQKKANVNIADIYGLTPLFYAAAYGDYIMTDMFLFYKGNQKVRDSEGKTPFMVAIWGGYPQIAKLLKDYGADIHTTDNMGNNALHLAVQNQDSICIDSLLNWGLSLEAQNKKGLTPLDLAVEMKNPPLVNKLIKAGANVNHTISKRFNTVDFAKSQHAPAEIQSMLIAAGGEINKIPAFTDFSLGFSYQFNRDDSRLGIYSRWTDRKYKLGLQAGITQRPGRKIVFHEVNDTLSYQFYETRTGLDLGITKQFRIAKINETEETGIELAVHAVASVADYKASSISGKFFLYAYPEISWYHTDRNINYHVGYQFIPEQWNPWSPHRINLCISFNINKKHE